MACTEAMSASAKIGAAILCAAFVFFAGAPARAQIVSVLDEHGQRVYINLEPKPAPVTPTAKSPVTGPDTGKDGPASGATAATPSSAAKNTGTPSGNLLTAKNGLTSTRLEELVQTTAARHNVDPALVRAVIQTESGGNPAAVSSKGAMGLMQLMPETALELGVKNVFNPQDNLEAGVKYLRTLLERYNGDLDKALAAYNAGAGAVDRAGGVPRYRETRDYVRKVTNNYLAADTSESSSQTAAAAAPFSASTSATTVPVAAKATSTAKTPPPAPPAHQMYQTVDAQGRVVWTNF
jgi:hypothetical protein